MGTYRKVIESAPDIRTIARSGLRGRWKEAVIFFAIYYLLTTFVGNILDVFFTYTQTIPFETLEGTTEDLVSEITYGSSIYSLLISGPITYGLSLWLLSFVRCQQTSNQMMFEGFSQFGKSFLIFIITSVKTALWSLLFVVPGVIAAYRYSQAFYVAIDHPEMSANECIEESKRIMSNNKASLFYLDLTFIGWYMVASLIGVGFSFATEEPGVLTAVAGFLASIPVLFVDAYSFVARTYFYELAIDNIDVVEEIKHVVEVEETVVPAEPVVEVPAEPAEEEKTEE